MALACINNEFVDVGEKQEMGNRTARRRAPANNPATVPATDRMDNILAMSDRSAVRLAMEQSLADAPLPFGWDSAYTSKGVLYFIDHANKTTTFGDPRITEYVHVCHRNILF
jgi:hypothetical protein